MAPKELSRAPCQEIVWEGKDVDLGGCRSRPAGRATPAPLITWGLTVTRGPAQDAAEPRHLPPAGDRAATRSSCAGWRTAAARSISAITALANPGQPLSGRGRAGRRPGDDPRRGDAGAGHACPNTSSPACCAARRTEIVKCLTPRSAGARDAPRSCWKAIIRCASDGYETALEGPFGDHTGYYNEQETFPGIHDRAHHHAARPDLSLDLHRQAARRAGDARRGAERSVRAAAAKAVSGNRRFLPAAGRLLAIGWRWSA